VPLKRPRFPPLGAVARALPRPRLPRRPPVLITQKGAFTQKTAVFLLSVGPRGLGKRQLALRAPIGSPVFAFEFVFDFAGRAKREAISPAAALAFVTGHRILVAVAARPGVGFARFKVGVTRVRGGLPAAPAALALSVADLLVHRRRAPPLLAGLHVGA
jgi:hypothetical protein